MFAAVRAIFSGSGESDSDNFESYQDFDHAKNMIRRDCNNLMILTQAMYEDPQVLKSRDEFIGRTHDVQARIGAIFEVSDPEPREIQILRLEASLREIFLPQVERLLNGSPADPPSVLLDKLDFCSRAEIKIHRKTIVSLRERLGSVGHLQTRLHHKVNELRGHLFVRGFPV